MILHFQNVNSMKTQMIFTLAMTTAFTACQKEVDLAKPQIALTAQSISQYSAVYIPHEFFIVGLARGNYCFSIYSEHWLIANACFEAGKGTKGSYPSHAWKHETGLYYIEAKGEGVSDQYGRSSSTLHLTFNLETCSLSGKLTTLFNSGEVLDMIIGNEVRVLPDIHTLTLVADIENASIDNRLEPLHFMKGEIGMTLPIQPTGRFQLNLNILGMFCT